MLIVQLCDFGTDGDCEYRIHEPSRQLGKLPSVSVIDCHFAHRSVPELAARADVLVIQFFNDWEMPSLCERRRGAGGVTVFEANDFFFDLQPWNPIAAHWRDRAVQELYLQLIKTADAVQTSSQWLAQRWRERGARDVAVFQNHLPSIDPLPDLSSNASGDSLTIGWAGSPGHFADWYATAPLLAKWLDSHPAARLAVMTNELAHSFFKLPPERYRFTPFGTRQQYLDFLRGVDIGIAPLLPTDYNRGRSDVKFLEYASQGVAGIYQDLDPYRDTVKHGETGMLYQTSAQLIESLDAYYTQPALRRAVRQRAYAYTAQNRMIKDRIGERLAWYQALLEKTRKTPITVTDTKPGEHREVRAGEAESTAMRAIAMPHKEGVPMLTGLLASHPDYLFLLQNLARQLNDQRRPQDALRCLEAARRLSPHSARAYSEVGRAYFLLGDHARALRAMEEAIGLSPVFLPGWQYLLRLLVMTKNADTIRWADRAIELFPTCYPVALLAVIAYPPAQAVTAMHALLDRVAPTLTADQEAVALTAFRKPVSAIAAAAPPGAEVVAMLERACSLFPRSARLAGELGSALTRAGREDEAHAHLSRAMSLRAQATAMQDEFAKDEQMPWEWIFSDHIHKHPHQ